MDQYVDDHSSEPVDHTFRVSRLISDSMIAQRDSDFPVWGYAPAGTEVTVTLGNESHSEASGRDGRWQVDFTPREAGGPHSMAISDGETTINVSDIWFGDVWVASGQSNMAWIVANSNDAEAEIAAADDPMIRQFKVPLSYSDTPENELAGGDWQIADPDHVANFSAVGYYFARELRKHVDVPIGILNTSWGGSRVEAWMSVETLGEDVVRNFREQERINQEELIARLTEKWGIYRKRTPDLLMASLIGLTLPWIPRTG